MMMAQRYHHSTPWFIILLFGLAYVLIAFTLLTSPSVEEQVVQHREQMQNQYRLDQKTTTPLSLELLTVDRHSVIRVTPQVQQQEAPLLAKQTSEEAAVVSHQEMIAQEWSDTPVGSTTQNETAHGHPAVVARTASRTTQPRLLLSN
jgi:hypothetical protein